MSIAAILTPVKRIFRASFPVFACIYKSLVRTVIKIPHHTYNVESYSIGKFVEEKFHLPFLHLETDYSESDTEQLRVRIEVFLEMAKG